MKYIIDFKNDVTETTINDFLLANNLVAIKQYSSFGKVYQVEGTTTPPQTDIVEAVTCDIDAPLKLQGINDLPTIDIPVNDQNWWKIVSLDQQYDSTKTTYTAFMNKPVFDVYLVDSGVNSNHTEFSNQIITDLFSITGEFSDSRGHGTALASVITGNTCAMSKANLVNVKVIDATSTLTIVQLVEALDAIKTHSDSRPLVPAIANMSWSIPKNDYVNAKIQSLIDSGIAVVASAGNSGIAVADVTPACIPDVFTVGAYNQSFTPCNFSNYTSPLATTPSTVNYGQIDVWAPGEQIWVANKDGGYYFTAGTSIAAAIFTASLSYNLSEIEAGFVQTFNETFNKVVASNTMAYATSIRKDILVLTGNYSSSVNKIATFCLHGSVSYNQLWQSTTGEILDSKHFKIWENQNVFKFLFPLEKVQSWEIIEGELPPGLTIDRGWVIGKVV